MSQHDIDRRLRSWVRSPADRQAPADLRRQVLGIPSAEPTGRQRRRAWFLSEPTAGADGQESPAQPTRTIDRTGGTRVMFSAAKMVGLAAAVALFGVLLVAGPLSLPGEVSAPPAAPAVEPGDVTHFSGTMRFLGQDHMGETTRYDWGTETLGEQWTTRLESDDPRFSGVYSAFHNVYLTQPNYVQLRTYNGRLFTKDGSWHIVSRGYTDPVTGGIIGHEYAVGEGPYEGLSALVTLLQKPGSSNVDFQGIIFEGDLPETPEDAPSEIPPIHLGP